MRKGKIIALAIALVIILAGELYLFARCTQGDMPLPAALTGGDQQSGTTPVVSQTAVPAPAVTSPPMFTSPPAYTPPPAYTALPETAPPTWTPVPTPTATPLPSAPPTDPPPTNAPVTPPPGTVVSSGSASSSTGTNLNMSISWQAVDMGGGITRVTVSGTVQSYSLQVMGMPVSISLGGYSTSVTGSAINITDDTYSNTNLFTTSFDVPSGTTGTLTATWNFQGTYSGVSLPTVTASGYVG